MENKKIFKNTFHLLHTLMLYSFLSLLFLPPSPFPTHPLSQKDAPLLQLLEDWITAAATPGCDSRRSLAGGRKNL